MKRILAAMAIAGLTYSSAIAQSSQINVCGIKQNKVCVVSKDRKTSACYKTNYAENFQVCKSEFGYYICCETPRDNNSTYSSSRVAIDTKPEMEQYRYTYLTKTSSPVDNTVPQNQSYINITLGSN